MADEPAPVKPRWSNPEDDAGFAQAFLDGATKGQPLALTDDEKDMLRLLMVKAADRGDADLVKRLQSFADNGPGFREFLRQNTRADPTAGS